MPMPEYQESDATDRQPSRAELAEDMRIDVTPESEAWAVTQGGTERREPDSDG